jgi:alpha/beta superfamily hydrolase
VPQETTLLATADGLTLEADVFLPAEPWAAAVVAHPHPLYGGDRTSPVVDAVARAVHGAGAAAVRFDFRGVGRSEGEYDDGVGERLDVAAAVDLAAQLAGDGPLLVAGYSFGALVALNVTDPRITAWLAVAPPLTMAPRPLAAGDHRPKLLLVAEHDQFCPPGSAAAAVEGWSNTALDTITMADHFLGGRTEAVGDAAARFLRELRLPA